MKHLSRAVALAAVLALAAAACNANDKSGTTGGSTAAAEQGGTFHILSTSKEISYDPAKSQNLGISGIHLVLRGLTSWKTDPSKPTELVPDLATDTGQVTDGGKTWTYKLKPGLKYADGSPIVAADIKYGVERSFAPELSGGLGYHKSLLVGGDKYTGPYKGGDLASIETPDETTIVFKLNKPYGDWPWIVSMPAFSPVPKKADTDPAHYGEKPMASGPYQVQSYTPGSKLVLTRNPNWDKSTDPARTGLPDSIVTDMGLQPDVVNQRLIADAGDDKFAATTGTSVPAALIPTITGNPAVKARVATSPSGALEYLAMNTKRPALANPAVRKAIEYAVDKQAVQVAEGGPEYGGEIASTLITPGIDGYTKYDSYEAPPAGDPAKAKQMLAAAGVSNLNLVLAADNTTGLGVAQAIQQGLKRAADRPHHRQQAGLRPDRVELAAGLPERDRQHPAALRVLGDRERRLQHLPLLQPRGGHGDRRRDGRAGPDEGGRSVGRAGQADHGRRTGRAADLRAERVPARFEGAELLPVVLPAVRKHPHRRPQQVAG
jgi:peptide/nickel transport system substrate-binding protein